MSGIFLKRTFRGGVHPNDNKNHTKYLKIEDLSAPARLVYPTVQQIGAAAEPVVAVGEAVKVGQLIAKRTGFVSANHHASVSGVVAAIEPRLHPNGNLVSSIIIDNDEKYEVFDGISPSKAVEQLTPGEIAAIVDGAGIVGMGGATFPTHVKLSPPPDKKIDCVIINGAECEPYLTSDYRVLLEDTEQLLTGCAALVKALGAANCVIAVELNKKDAIATVEENIQYHKSGVRVMALETKYPQGSEKQLISVVAGREVPPGGLPADVGVAVFNIDTCAAVARAIQTGMPLITRVVTVAGSAFANHRNFRVRIGTPVADVIAAVGGFASPPEKVLLGGPMMGTALFSYDVPVIKGTGAVLALTREDLGTQEVTNCIKCGKCVRACPMRLLPAVIDRYRGRFDAMPESLNVNDCIECGACSYICPAGRDPLQSVRAAKQKLRAKK